jgi:hypothetical protein
MSRPVYSTRFTAEYAVSPSASYTVPSGFVAVVRDCDAWCQAGSTDPWAAWGCTTLGGAVWEEFSAGSINFVGWRGRQVFYEGEVLYILGNSETPMFIILSGYLLTTP